MIPAQAASDSTPVEKIAARDESRSVRRLSRSKVAAGIDISKTVNAPDEFLKERPRGSIRKKNTAAK